MNSEERLEVVATTCDMEDLLLFLSTKLDDGMDFELVEYVEIEAPVDLLRYVNFVDLPGNEDKSSSLLNTIGTCFVQNTDVNTVRF